MKFFDTNGYVFTELIDRSTIILLNTCCVTQDKIAQSISALDFAKARGDGKRIVLFGCLAGLDVPGVEHEGLICIGPKNLGELDGYFPHHTSVNSIFIGVSNELGGFESGLVAALLGPIFAVVSGGIGTILVVLAVARAWPAMVRLKRLDQAEE